MDFNNLDSFKNFAIGCDIEEISRFKTKNRITDAHFLTSLFTTAELDYCFASNQFASHLAVRFCAKEAIYKALSSLAVCPNISLLDIEILNHANGVPYASVKGYPNLVIKISLSHSKTTAMASVLIGIIK